MDNDWFQLESNKEGTRCFGKCWYTRDLHESDIQSDIPITYATATPEIIVLEFDGKTAEMLFPQDQGLGKPKGNIYLFPSPGRIGGADSPFGFWR